MADNHGSCAAVLDTHELCDYIIHFLHDSEEDLQSYDVTVGISLASFPALTKLRLIGHPHEIEAALASFPRVLDRLQTLVLASGTLAPSLALHVDALKRIDAQLAELHLPALARLEMSVLPSSDMHPHHDLTAIEATHVAVTEAFVCMGKCGVLVRDFRGTLWILCRHYIRRHFPQYGSRRKGWFASPQGTFDQDAGIRPGGSNSLPGNPTRIERHE
ncbi:hypothetical protein C8R44DRAFT_851042 [Mycena epipterygia]|nr:hypothetical protein C8R44DRAFT_851042 [Mycena epipterygia]